MPSNHLILYRPLLLLPSIFPSIRVFSTSLFFASGGQSTGVSASASVLPNGRESLYRGRQIAVRSLGWALVPYDWCAYQRGRVDTDTLSRGEHLVKRWRWRFYEVKSGEGYSKPRKAGQRLQAASFSQLQREPTCPHNVWGEKVLFLHFLKRWVFHTSGSSHSPAWLPLNITERIPGWVPLATYSLVPAEDVDTVVCSLCGGHATQGFSSVDHDPCNEPRGLGGSGCVVAGGGLLHSFFLREGSPRISAEAEEPLGKEEIQWSVAQTTLRFKYPTSQSQKFI